jgi:hypothetical protein
MIEPHLEPPSAPWGRMCVWCEGVSIGDINEEHCGLEVFEALSYLISQLDDLWLDEFEGLSDFQLWKKRGQVESAGINRHRVGDERALHERRSCSIMAPSHASATREGAAKR